VERGYDLIFDKGQLEEFLKKLDNELTTKVELNVIGGAAATLMYDSKAGTRDIDTWGTVRALQEAYQRVIKKYPELKLPFGPSNVHIQSSAMLKRFVLYEKLDLSKLKIKVPLPEDLFLLKAQRADEKDVDDLIELHKKVALDQEKILNWFKTDLLPLNGGNDVLLIEKYLFCIDLVFGSTTARKHEKSLPK